MNLHIEDLLFAINVLFGTRFACTHWILRLEMRRVVNHTHVDLLLPIGFDSRMRNVRSYIVDKISQIVWGVSFAGNLATKIPEFVIKDID